MPKSKKGRLSGAARKELNERRSADAVSGRADGILFARVAKLTGAGHVRVLIDTKHGPKEIQARIPNVLGRRGSTPITSKDVVSLFVGPDFDPDAPISKGDHFDITAILTQRQAYQLAKSGEIPEWMTHDISDEKKVSVAGESGGFEFDYSGVKEGADEEDSDSESETDGAPKGFQRKAPVDDEIDVDAI